MNGGMRRESPLPASVAEDAAVHAIAATVERLAVAIAERAVEGNRAMLEGAALSDVVLARMDEDARDVVGAAARAVLFAHFTGNLAPAPAALPRPVPDDARERAARSVFAAAGLVVDESDPHCWKVGPPAVKVPMPGPGESLPVVLPLYLFWPATTFWRLPRNGGAQGAGAAALVSEIEGKGPGPGEAAAADSREST